VLPISSSILLTTLMHLHKCSKASDDHDLRVMTSEDGGHDRETLLAASRPALGAPYGLFLANKRLSIMYRWSLRILQYCITLLGRLTSPESCPTMPLILGIQRRAVRLSILVTPNNSTRLKSVICTFPETSTPVKANPPTDENTSSFGIASLASDYEGEIIQSDRANTSSY
jgi:hypothetical protein